MAKKELRKPVLVEETSLTELTMLPVVSGGAGV